MENKQELNIQPVERVVSIEELVGLLPSLLNDSMVPFAIGYPDGKLMTCNTAFRELTGYTDSDFFAMDNPMPIIPSEWSEHAMKCFYHTQSTGKPGRFELELLRKNGERVPVEMFDHAVKDSAGNVLYYYIFIINITDHKSTRQALRESEDKYRKLAEAAMDIIYIVDKDLKITYLNPAGAASLGGDPGKFIGTDLMDLFPADTYEQMRSSIVRVLDSGRTLVRESGVRFFDKKMWQHVHLIPLRDARGEINAVLGISRDITDLKNAEEALRESEVKYRTLAESANDCIYVVDKDLNVKYINRYGAGCLGCSPANVNGKPLKDIFPPAMYEQFAGNLKNVISAGKECSGENTILFGKVERWQHTQLIPLLDNEGVVESVMGISRDITGDKLAEKALRQSEANFRALAETSTAGIVITQDNKVVYVNSAAEKISSYSREELLTMDVWKTIMPSSREEMKEQYARFIEHRYTPAGCIVDFFTRSGEARSAEITYGIIEYNAKLALLVTIFDVTDRKRTEKALVDAKKQADLYIDLMGHDINNINQIAMGYLELAMEMPDVSEDQRQYISRPLEVLKSSVVLIDTVRKIQRAKSGDLERVVIDLGALLNLVKSEYSSAAGRNVSIMLENGSGCMVSADELLKDVFSNLVVNAIKHSKGDVNIAIQVTAAYENEGKNYIVTVEDDGPGITDEVKGRLFDRLWSGNSRVKGKGIGLYLVKTLLQSYGGRIWVEDRVRGDHTKGSRFVVMLPAI